MLGISHGSRQVVVRFGGVDTTADAPRSSARHLIAESVREPLHRFVRPEGIAVTMEHGVELAERHRSVPAQHQLACAAEIDAAQGQRVGRFRRDRPAVGGRRATTCATGSGPQLVAEQIETFDDVAALTGEVVELFVEGLESGEETASLLVSFEPTVASTHEGDVDSVNGID